MALYTNCFKCASKASKRLSCSILAGFVWALTTLIAHAAPSISLANPAQPTWFSAPAYIKLAVNVSDSAGTITNVSYYQNGTKIADVTTNPFGYFWPGVGVGNYAIEAVAMDNLGLAATSPVVNITVSNMSSTQIVQQVQTVFVIAMENHNFKQPNPTNSPQQIFGNPAAPYINSLFTPGNSNAAQASFSTAYYTAGMGVHPSEPNYIWAEAGSGFGVSSDNDPSSANGNLFTKPHLMAQMNSAGIAWKNYQEDLQYSSSAAVSAYGTSSATNFFNGSHQYGYAAKHNPMAFFTDTQTQNVVPLTNLFNDLNSNTVARYNWITPDICNDQHDGLTSSFVYHGVSYTGDQEAVALGDNFLSILVPIIMNSQVYRSNGIIIIRWDETEGGDGTNYTIPHIIISPLAKGNAYSSSVVMSHSSHVKTMEEIFGLSYVSNAIPSSEVTAFGSGYNYVATANDFSDMLQAVIPITGTTNSTNALEIVSERIVPGAGFQLVFSGNAGQGYHLLASTNPVGTWSVLTNDVFGATNAIFLDADATNHAGRFYRLKSP